MASRLIVGPFRDNDDQEGNCLAMQESLVRNSTIRVWERAAERRLGVSRLLAQALELTRQPSHRTAVRSRLERDIGYLLNARSVSIRERVGTFQAMAVREGPGVLTMPIPGLSNPPMVLEVRAESQDLDAWARHPCRRLSNRVRWALGVPHRSVTVSGDGPVPQAVKPTRAEETRADRWEYACRPSPRTDQPYGKDRFHCPRGG